MSEDTRIADIDGDEHRINGSSDDRYLDDRGDLPFYVDEDYPVRTSGSFMTSLVVFLFTVLGFTVGVVLGALLK